MAVAAQHERLVAVAVGYGDEHLGQSHDYHSRHDARYAEEEIERNRQQQCCQQVPDGGTRQTAQLADAFQYGHFAASDSHETHHGRQTEEMNKVPVPKEGVLAEQRAHRQRDESAHYGGDKAYGAHHAHRLGKLLGVAAVVAHRHSLHGTHRQAQIGAVAEELHR